MKPNPDGNPIVGLVCLLFIVIVGMGTCWLLFNKKAVADRKERQEKWRKQREEEQDRQLQEQKRKINHLFAGLRCEIDKIESSVFERLCTLQSQLKVTIPFNLGEEIGIINRQLEILQRRRECPFFVALCTEVVGEYANIFQLLRTEISSFQVQGGGFGVIGAMQGIVLAESINHLLRLSSNAKNKALLQQIQQKITKNEIILNTMKEIIP